MLNSGPPARSWATAFSSRQWENGSSGSVEGRRTSSGAAPRSDGPAGSVRTRPR